MKTSSILAILLLLLLSAACKLFKHDKLFSTDNDSLLNTSEQIVEESIDSTFIEEPVEEVISTPVIHYRYFMIVGSFYNEVNAERYANDLADQGYSTEIHYSENGFYRVSAKGYEDFRTGVNEIELFRSTVTPSAWLYVKN